MGLKPSLRSPELLARYRQLAIQPLTVVDVETTGHRPPAARVIEVSVLHASLKDGILEQSTLMINPATVVPGMITRFTGITQAMVDQGIPAAIAWPRLAGQLGGGVLTAHNLSFDYSFLVAEYKRLGQVYARSPEEQLCTVHLSRLLLADLPSRSLPDLVRHFKFPIEESHRAEADTLACWYLAQRLLSDLQDQSDDLLIERFQQEWLNLNSAAKLLGRSRPETQMRLSEAGFKPRLSERSGSPRYRRGWVESVWERLVAPEPKPLEPKLPGLG